MSAELPLVSAVVARLAHPEIQLAAYGGVVFPLALIIESPIIMLLAASTALSKDWASYVLLRRFMMWLSAGLTGLHVLIAFTPLYYTVAQGVIGAPPEILEPARLGLMIMVPWTWSIAYRRFHQGVLIRFDQARAVGLGTLTRFVAVALCLSIGALIGLLPGIVVAAGAVIVGILSEATFIGWRVRRVVRDRLKPAPAVEPALTYRAFLAFYLPLVLTAFLTLGTQPILSAALSRMPRAIESLATWTVLTGVLFILESMGVALNEVVVALLDEPGSTGSLRRFTWLLAAITTGLILLMAATPLSLAWFGGVAGLAPSLVELARRALWLALPIPALAVLQSWFQGALLNSRRTRGITEAVIINVLTGAIMLSAGVVLGQWAGLYVGVAAIAAGLIIQTAWLWWRSRPALRAAQARDAALGPAQPLGAGAD
jgi:hypothetical protein